MAPFQQYLSLKNNIDRTYCHLKPHADLNALKETADQFMAKAATTQNDADLFQKQYLALLKKINPPSHPYWSLLIACGDLSLSLYNKMLPIGTILLASAVILQKLAPRKTAKRVLLGVKFTMPIATAIHQVGLNALTLTFAAPLYGCIFFKELFDIKHPLLNRLLQMGVTLAYPYIFETLILPLTVGPLTP
jgi:hypothetical protein